MSDTRHSPVAELPSGFEGEVFCGELRVSIDKPLYANIQDFHNNQSR